MGRQIPPETDLQFRTDPDTFCSKKSGRSMSAENCRVALLKLEESELSSCSHQENFCQECANTCRSCEAGAMNYMNCQVCTHHNHDLHHQHQLQQMAEARMSLSLPFRCDFCGRCFGLASGLRRHINRMHSAPCMIGDQQVDSYEEIPGGVSCAECRKVFNSIPTLRNHMTTVHTDNRPRCHLCFKTFASSSGLKIHTSSVHGVTSPDLSCPLCGFVSATRAQYKDHMSITHATDRFVCKQCGRNFSSALILRNHVTREHITLRCELCAKKFSTDSGLRSHLTTVHTGERYHCQQCTKSFSQAHSLRAHMSKIHPNIPMGAVHVTSNRPPGFPQMPPGMHMQPPMHLLPPGMQGMLLIPHPQMPNMQSYLPQPPPMVSPLSYYQQQQQQQAAGLPPHPHPQPSHSHQLPPPPPPPPPALSKSAEPLTLPLQDENEASDMEVDVDIKKEPVDEEEEEDDEDDEAQAQANRLTCDECGRTFPRQKHLERHLVRAHNLHYMNIV